MKRKILLMAVFMMSIGVFAQKSEIKAAKKAIKKSDFVTALSELKKIEGTIGQAKEKYQDKYYYYKALAVYKNGLNKNYKEVAKAFNDLFEFEKTYKKKYTDDLREISNKLIQDVANKANADYQKATQSKEPKDYVNSAKGYEAVYLFSPRDTSFLDNAALLYYLGKDFKASRDAYQKLLDINYTGAGKVYIATNKATGKEVTFADKKAMDQQVKFKICEKPRVEQKESRRPTVYKNLSLATSELGDKQKALEIIQEGRKEFPKDYALLIDEANAYYHLGDKAKFKEKLEAAIQMNPTEPTLYYNVGVMNMNQDKTEEAIKNFEKAIELKPDYADAYTNIGAAYVNKANPIIEEMNKNLSDFAKYDQLQAQQLDLYKKALPYYEKAYELDKNNISTIQTLLGLYENLEMSDKASALKAVYDAMK
ncbi:MAG: tetratricopeptide repeat protein [Flavobacteriaceae bacterium]|nr:tetratricopeptide repeat protein [Flavobacteriaceae bacterium]